MQQMAVKKAVQQFLIVSAVFSVKKKYRYTIPPPTHTINILLLKK